MKKLKFVMVVTRDGDGYMATFPEIPGCFTGADTMEELKARADDVVKAFLSIRHDEGQEIPEGVGNGVVETLEVENDPAAWKSVLKSAPPIEAS